MPEIPDPYAAAIEATDGVNLKGKANPYTSMNGHMFSFLSKEGDVCFRYAEPRRKELADEFGVAEVRAHGAVMRGYVAMPDHVLADPIRLKALFAESLAYVQTLKPK